MKKIVRGILAIAAFTFSAAAQDQKTDQKKWDKDRQHQHMGDGGRMQGMDQLNLTESQKLQMKAINEDFRTRMQALMQERKSKISALLAPDQRTKFDQMHKEGGRDGRMEGKEQGDIGRGRGDLADQMKTELSLTGEQVAKMKSGNESFRQRGKAIHDNQSLSADQKKVQFEALQKEKENSFKSYLTADQIAKLDQMKKSHGDWKGKDKEKGDGWKEKNKSEDGKEKIKVKTT